MFRSLQNNDRKFCNGWLLYIQGEVMFWIQLIAEILDKKIKTVKQKVLATFRYLERRLE